MSRKPKGVDLLTGAVLDARDLIVRRTEELTHTYRPSAFMQAKVSPKTLDRYLLNITPQEMADLAARNPEQAERYAARVNLLEQKLDARQPLPAQDSWEGDIEEP